MSQLLVISQFEVFCVYIRICRVTLLSIVNIQIWMFFRPFLKVGILESVTVILTHQPTAQCDTDGEHTYTKCLHTVKKQNDHKWRIEMKSILNREQCQTVESIKLTFLSLFWGILLKSDICLPGKPGKRSARETLNSNYFSLGLQHNICKAMMHTSGRNNDIRRRLINPVVLTLSTITMYWNCPELVYSMQKRWICSLVC